MGLGEYDIFSVLLFLESVNFDIPCRCSIDICYNRHISRNYQSLQANKKNIALLPQKNHSPCRRNNCNSLRYHRKYILHFHNRRHTSNVYLPILFRIAAHLQSLHHRPFHRH